MPDSQKRPDPDALLKRVHAEEVRAQRAKLKIFFGFAPGVGKTYAMLESAAKLRAEGTDVVVGCVETHGRAETEAQTVGLDVIPKRVFDYKGTKLAEFDLDATLARHPKVLLLDELAHTNAPGARHAKRWQDVLELLDAGIDVHTTLNVQHVESLNDVVAQVTQVRVRETVPDQVIDRADVIELVDLPPDDLLARLAAGKVYLGDQAARAAQHFFQRGNLLALRELALRRTAERVDADVRAYREEHAIAATWPAGERILVCVGPSPQSARLVRATRRLADSLHAKWMAVSVETTTGRPLTEANRVRLDAHLRLAESLGGEIARLTGESVSATLLDHARQNNVTRILIGKPTHSRLRDLIRGSLLDEVVRGSGDIDVQVISGDPESPLSDSKRASTPSRAAFDWRPYSGAAALVALCTSLCIPMQGVLTMPDFAMLYMLAIMVSAARWGRGASMLAAGLSVGAYDFFFVPPYFTFSVSDTRHVLTFAMMFGVGFVISTLTARIRRQELEARRREARTAALFGLSRALGAAPDVAEVCAVIARETADILRAGCAVLTREGDQRLGITARRGELQWGNAEDGVAKWVFEHGRPAGRGTDTLPGARVTCVPLAGTGEPLGVLAYATGPASATEERHLIDAFARQGALALSRARLAEEARSAALRARTEEMRSSLLSAVSHDLRTPLAAITGSATTLRDDSATLSVAERDDLTDAIVEEAERLERLVGNLLDMTRLESGALKVRREWVPVDEVLGGALTRLEPALAGRSIQIDLPSKLPLLSVDPVLFGQVFVNLLDNAAKYTPKDSPLELSASVDAQSLFIDVSDRGPGIPAGDEERVFEKFYRGSHEGVGGAGLGLAICRGVVEAHGGTLTALRRDGGGTTFRVSLPLAEGAPSLAPDAPRPTQAAP